MMQDADVMEWIFKTLVRHRELSQDELNDTENLAYHGAMKALEKAELESTIDSDSSAK